MTPALVWAVQWQLPHPSNLDPTVANMMMFSLYARFPEMQYSDLVDQVYDFFKRKVIN